MHTSAPPIYSVADIRSIEAIVLPSARPSLMERAGRAVAEDAVRLTLDRPGPILIACGPGNNGGDGFVMARHLHLSGRPVVVAFAGNPAELPDDAAAAHRAWRASGGVTTSDLPAPPAEGWSLVVDALFGIGLQRPIEGRYRTWIQTLNAQKCRRLALDVPSGIDADNGRVLGIAFQATHTSTFIALKPGLLTLDGPDYAGEVLVQRLEIDPRSFLQPKGQTVIPGLFRHCLRPRPRNCHKGLFGDVAIIGGAPGMVGAALLAGRAAIKLGGGRVFVGLLDRHGPAVDFFAPELMLRAPESLLECASCVAIGPGLGQSESASGLLGIAILQNSPLVIDADGLNLLGRFAHLKAALASREQPAVLTPHPAEAGRMLGCSTADVQADRVGTATRLAKELHAVVVLKGCGTVIAGPQGDWYINGTGHGGLATAGSGDVLTGILVSLLAQHWPPLDAALAAVHLHGRSAEWLAQREVGPVGLTAGELVDAARQVFNAWIQQARCL
ncbi:MAG: NAD(P)H-hydrate dehydratase [Zoogloeaceae bacterium]|nr:NAD(P)H-hydrate dehydratase [Zoogloeaceae bacterium]